MSDEKNKRVQKALEELADALEIEVPEKFELELEEEELSAISGGAAAHKQKGGLLKVKTQTGKDGVRPRLMSIDVHGCC